jgi:3-oxoacyl-[acyl-carrier-protein] synthase III
MSILSRAAIVGTGYAVPAKVRHNDDPIFDYITKNDPTHGKLFFGYVERRVLDDGECIETYMVQAAQAALADAKLMPADIDMLLGYTSIAPYLTPNSLVSVHARLGLSTQCWAMPVQADYSNYLASLLIADAMVTSGRAKNVLIVCGSNWSRNVSYLTPPCVSIGDGAGAAVVSASNDMSHFRIVDFEVTETSSGYGGMFTDSDPVPDAEKKGPKGSPFNESFSHPYFHLTPAGVQEFQQWGTQAPPQTVNALLTRNALDGSQVALVTYQASAMLVDAWKTAVKPRQMLDTLTTFGNTCIAAVAVNFASRMQDIETDHVVLISLGPDPHAVALLLRRNG